MGLARSQQLLRSKAAGPFCVSTWPKQEHGCTDRGVKVWLSPASYTRCQTKRGGGSPSRKWASKTALEAVLISMAAAARVRNSAAGMGIAAGLKSVPGNSWRSTVQATLLPVPTSHAAQTGHFRAGNPE